MSVSVRTKVETGKNEEKRKEVNRRQVSVPIFLTGVV